MNIPPMLMNMLYSKLGGAQNCQQIINTASQMMQSNGLTPQQYLQALVNNGTITQQGLNNAIQQYNNMVGGSAPQQPLMQPMQNPMNPQGGYGGYGYGGMR